jgi:hypothetical protein
VQNGGENVKNGGENKLHHPAALPQLVPQPPIESH